MKLIHIEIDCGKEEAQALIELFNTMLEEEMYETEDERQMIENIITVINAAIKKV